jgi:hypothetical protein
LPAPWLAFIRLAPVKESLDQPARITHLSSLVTRRRPAALLVREPDLLRELPHPLGPARMFGRQSSLGAQFAEEPGALRFGARVPGATERDEALSLFQSMPSPPLSLRCGHRLLADRLATQMSSPNSVTVQVSRNSALHRRLELGKPRSPRSEPVPDTPQRVSSKEGRNKAAPTDSQRVG